MISKHFRSVSLCCMLLISAPALAAGKLTICVGAQQQGLREGDTLYPLRLTRANFEKQFGAPDALHDFKETSPGCIGLLYRKEGLMVVIEKGLVKEYDAFLLPDADYGLQGASYTTDSGVNSESSKRDIIKIHGQPTSQFNDTIAYLYDGWTLTFSFSNGTLKSIGINVRPK